MNSYADEQRRRNLERRDSWDCFSAHRAQATRLLSEGATAADAGSLCVLGAGNCNDLDLNSLTRSFDRIHLVDLDAEALREGVRRQGLAESDGIIQHGVDLIGGQPGNGPLDAAELLTTLRDVPHVSDVKHDRVASICTLSQVIEFGVRLLGAEHSALTNVILALRRQHLEVMVSLLRPGGIGLLITDFVSSDTCPELREMSLDQLPAAASRWIAERNFFTGANPFAIKQFLEREMEAVEPTSVTLHKPWKWDLGPRIYAVAAIQFRRS